VLLVDAPPQVLSDFTLESQQGRYSLRLVPRASRQYRATLDGPDVHAVATIYDVTGKLFAFAGFWRDLASHWRGWSGPKSWKSDEGDLELNAQSDGRGHIGIECSVSRGTPQLWRVKVVLLTEAAALEGLASQAAAFAASVCRQT